MILALGIDASHYSTFIGIDLILILLLLTLLIFALVLDLLCIIWYPVVLETQKRDELELYLEKEQEKLEIQQNLEDEYQKMIEEEEEKLRMKDDEIDDIPTTAEFNARTLVAADYVVTTDTIAGITGTVSTFDALILELDDTATVVDAVWNETSTGHTGEGAAGAQLWTVMNDIPTTAEFEARTLVTADYVVTGDTIAGVTTVGSVTGSVGSISGVTFPTNFANLAITATTGRVDVSLIEGGDATDAIQTIAGAALTSYDPPTATEMTSAFTEIKGATWAATDSLEAIRNQGDAAWITATGFSTHAAADIWSVATRELSGTVGDFDALILTLDDTATVVDAVWDEASTGHIDAGKAGAQLWTDVDAILVDTAVIGALGAGLTAIPWNSSWDTEVQSECADALVAIDLDHLLNTALPTPAASDIQLNSAFGYLLDNGTAWTYDRTTDSLEAIGLWNQARLT